jgi:hypothetical protein
MRTLSPLADSMHISLEPLLLGASGDVDLGVEEEGLHAPGEGLVAAVSDLLAM